MNTHRKSAAQLQDRWLWLARITWLVITLLLLVVFSLSLRLTYHEMVAQPHGSVVDSPISPDILRTGLAQLRLSTRFYAGYLSVMLSLFVLVYTGVGVVIFWRKADDPLALLISFWLVVFGTTFPPPIDSLVQQTTQTDWLTSTSFMLLNVLTNGGLIAFFLLFYLFPDGRFVPQRTRWLAAIFVGTILITYISPGSLLDLNRWPPLLNLLFLLSFGLSMLYAQVYRYRHVSGPVQRQQTKWVVFGLASALAGFVLAAVSNMILPWLKQPSLVLIYDLSLGTTVILTFLCVPLAIGVAILRYHLYDIDIIIRRTLIYSVLTGMLALVYFSSVFLILGLLGPIVGWAYSAHPTIGQYANIVLAISTLFAAALAAPLHHRVQAGIDHRFYRRKYDAERVLAAFNATLRDETDLDKLTTALVAVVQETFQPNQLSLWLKPVAPAPRGYEVRTVQTTQKETVGR